MFATPVYGKSYHRVILNKVWQDFMSYEKISAKSSVQKMIKTVCNLVDSWLWKLKCLVAVTLDEINEIYQGNNPRRMDFAFQENMSRYLLTLFMMYVKNSLTWNAYFHGRFYLC